MFWIDYLVIFIPLIVMAAISLYSRKYVKGVSDFLTASRVAGRYVIAVAGGEAAMGLISVIAIVEVYYASGFGYGFWSKLIIPISMFLSLTGFCTYRFRETRAMTTGQLLEMRYSRSFRITAAVIQAASGILNYGIFPAVGARFLIYYLDLPMYLDIGSWHCPMFALMVTVCLTVAAVIACLGGQITIMVSDCVQGIISYPLYMILVFYFFYRFSWNRDILPALLARPPGQSFLNPYDIQHLRDFNLFYVFVGVCNTFFNRLSWAGCQGYSAAARSPHEQKMGGLLGSWRGGFSHMMLVMIALVVYTYMHDSRFESGPAGANAVNYQLAQKTLSDVAGAPKYDAQRDAILLKLKHAAPRFDTKTNLPVEKSNNSTVDNYDRIATEELRRIDPKLAQTYGAIHTQMRAGMTMREMLPIGITGIFAVLMIFLMISTDNTYMHSWGTILIQDILLPIRGKPFSPKHQLLLLRCGILFVALFAFVFSLFFAQVDYIMMFMEITGAIWIGGGTVITLGLYWKRGTSAGAFAGLIGGALVALGGIFGQHNWVGVIYPWLERTGNLAAVSGILTAVSKPFNPYVVWTVTPYKFPVNSREIAFLGLLVSIVLFAIASLITCRKPFNLDRMLHRGLYSDDGIGKPVPKIDFIKFCRGLIGITPEYSKGDKVLAWTVVCWSIGYAFAGCFLVPLIWNFFYRWPAAWWGNYFWFTSIFMTSLVGLISTFWFAIGGTLDLRRLFRDLAEKKVNDLDDGRVINNVSAVDAARVAEVENTQNRMEMKMSESDKEKKV